MLPAGRPSPKPWMTELAAASEIASATASVVRREAPASLAKRMWAARICEIESGTAGHVRLSGPGKAAAVSVMCVGLHDIASDIARQPRYPGDAGESVRAGTVRGMTPREVS